MLGRKRERNKSKSSKNDKFIYKLYDILRTPKYEKIIHWSQDGKTIVISSINKLSKKILPIFYNHHNYSSFVRQLNMYNFHKIRNKTVKNYDEQIFIHENFNKNLKFEEIKNIERKNSKNNSDLMVEEKSKTLDENCTTTVTRDNEEMLKNANENKFAILHNMISNKKKLNEDDKKKILLYLLEKNKENMDYQNELMNKINELNQQKNSLYSQIKICNNKILEQSDSLKKLKTLYFILFSILMKNNDRIKDKESSKIRNKTLKDLLYKFYLKKCDNNRIVLNNKNSNIVQKGEAFSINNEMDMNPKLKQCFNPKNSDLLSIESDKNSNDSFCDDFPLFNNYKNLEEDFKCNSSLASSYSMLNNSNLCNYNINPNINNSFSSNSIFGL